MYFSSLVGKTLKHLHRSLGFLKTDQKDFQLGGLWGSNVLYNHGGLFCRKCFLECYCFLEKLKCSWLSSGLEGSDQKL